MKNIRLLFQQVLAPSSHQASAKPAILGASRTSSERLLHATEAGRHGIFLDQESDKAPSPAFCSATELAIAVTANLAAPASGVLLCVVRGMYVLEGAGRMGPLPRPDLHQLGLFLAHRTSFLARMLSSLLYIRHLSSQ